MTSLLKVGLNGFVGNRGICDEIEKLSVRHNCYTVFEKKALKLLQSILKKSKALEVVLFAD